MFDLSFLAAVFRVKCVECTDLALQPLITLYFTAASASQKGLLQLTLQYVESSIQFIVFTVICEEFSAQ